MVLKDIPADARPREKLLRSGAASLADAELVALLLRTGFKGTSVLQLAQNTLDAFGGVQGMLHADASQLKRVKGLGPAKRAEIAAVIELSRRALAETLAQRPGFDHPAAVKNYLRLQLGAHGHEVFAVMFLDVGLRLLKFEEMFRGTLTGTAVHSREIVKRALELGADSVVLAHNHPSGSTQPSAADEALTRRLVDALKLIDVRVLDHFIVGANEVTSFAERGLL